MTLRERFEKETELPAFAGNDFFRHSYVEWLEQKLTSKREDQRFEAAKQNTAAMVSTINCEEDYRRLKKIAGCSKLTVSQWIAKDSVKQADALMQALEGK